jgi:hypothetical protein
MGGKAVSSHAIRPILAAFRINLFGYNYWTARTHEAAGNQTEANAHYQNVVADGILSRWREQAIASLARSNT